MDIVSKPIAATHHGAWMEIVLNKPETLNALDETMIGSLRARLLQAETDKSVKAVLLRAAGHAFCVGQDLRNRDPRLSEERPDLRASVENNYNPLIQQLSAMTKPTVCAVHGAVAGAGMGLALSCDIVLAGDNAKFHFAFSRIGLVPDSGVSWHLPRLVGSARAKGIALLGRELNAHEAVSWGLIWQAMPKEVLRTNAASMTELLASGPATSHRLTKQLATSSTVRSLGEQLGLEAEYQGICGETDDYREGVLAFLEKRSARFQ